MTKEQNREHRNRPKDIRCKGEMSGQRRNFWSEEKGHTGSEIELGQLAIYEGKIIFDSLAHRLQK